MADEDVTDLTEDEDEEESSGKKKKGKKKKKEKAPKEKKAKKEKVPKEKKEKPPKEPKPKKGKPTGPTTEGEKPGGGYKFILFIVVLVLLVSSLIAGIIVFNFFGVRDMVTDTLISAVVALEPDFATVDHELEHREAQLRAREEQLYRLDLVISGLEEELIDLAEFLAPAEFDSFAEFITAFARGLINIENQLQSREAQLDRRSAALDRQEEDEGTRDVEQLPLFRRNLSGQELEDITSLSKTFTQMSPDNAATILAEMEDPNQVASILYFMDERNASAILAAMEVEFAAELTELLILE